MACVALHNRYQATLCKWWSEEKHSLCVLHFPLLLLSTRKCLYFLLTVNVLHPRSIAQADSIANKPERLSLESMSKQSSAVESKRGAEWEKVCYEYTNIRRILVASCIWKAFACPLKINIQLLAPYHFHQMKLMQIEPVYDSDCEKKKKGSGRGWEDSTFFSFYSSVNNRYLLYPLSMSISRFSHLRYPAFMYFYTEHWCNSLFEIDGHGCVKKGDKAILATSGQKTVVSGLRESIYSMPMPTIQACIIAMLYINRVIILG